MKPKFDTLPPLLQESILWDMELDYDHYESSVDYEINLILAGCVSPTNKLVIANYYKALNEDDLKERIRLIKLDMEYQLKKLTEISDNIP